MKENMPPRPFKRSCPFAAVNMLRLATSFMVLAIVLAISGLGLLLVPGGVPYGMLAAIMMALIGGTLLFYLLARLVGTREARSGYTTLTNRYRELPQLDPLSGTVIREPGKPYHTASKRKR
ncbi:hypothetical protein [Leifsonia sp. 2MCAF36]|uniref:hypothetical protein n=1 Tax=Leifsonia sp. 2MCAF36 TaxID=3232988 RepID=UPI003F95F2D9